LEQPNHARPSQAGASRKGAVAPAQSYSKVPYPARPRQRRRAARFEGRASTLSDHDTAPLLLVGPGGPAGHEILAGLLDAGAPVIAVSPDVPGYSRPNLTWMQHDLVGHARIQSHVMICADAEALPLAARQVRAMPMLRRIIALSSASVVFKQRSADPGERETVERLVESEQSLAETAGKRGIELTLLRPTLIYGGRAPSALHGIRSWLEQRSWAPIAGNGLRQPVHADDLAALVRQLAAGSGSERGSPVETLSLGGGETLQYPEFVRRIASGAGIDATLVRMPAWLIASALRIAHRLGRFRSVTPVMIARQRMDLVVDDTRAREQLGWNPRPFRP